MARMIIMTALALSAAGLAQPSAPTGDDAKTAAIRTIRRQFAENREYIHYSVRDSFTPDNTARYLELLEPDGRFADLHLDEFTPERYDGATQQALGGKLFETFKRIRLLTQLVLIDGEHRGSAELKRAMMLATIYYGDIELRRCEGWFRFHASCFGIPRIVYGVYFAFFEDFDAAEHRGDTASLEGRAALVLQKLMRQTFTQPRRQDVADPYSVEQFRKSVAYVGGNFAYRPAFEAAAICRDSLMFDVVAAVAAGSLDVVSHNTVDSAFWSEGMCADGAGWGHGAQCYVWGYPTDGVLGSLSLLNRFRDTPWDAAVTPAMLQRVADYIAGAVWYQYLGRATLMSPGRVGFAAGPGRPAGAIDGMVDRLLAFDLDPETVDRLMTLAAQRQAERVEIYGTRYFWNNDDLIRRTPEAYIGVNMTGSRSQSNEVVQGDSSAFTDFFGDGATIIHRDGLEYAWAKGAWDCAAIPGTTVREQTLSPARLWGGYRGVHNWAGGVADGDAGCAGFIYEKAPAPNHAHPALYGVTGHKAYFFIDDVMLALGAGIRNLTPDVPGILRTTIDQPEWRGPVTVSAPGIGRETTPQGTGTERTWNPSATGDLLVEHHGIAYRVLAEHTAAPIRLTAGTRPTDWITRHGGNRNAETLPEQVAVLQLWLDHGTVPNPDNRTDTYAYIVDPRGSRAGAAGTPRIVANTTAMQAVRNASGTTVQVIAYAAGATYDDGDLRIVCDQPAVLMLRRQPDGVTLTVSDPTQRPEVTEMHIRTNLALHGDGITATADGSLLRVPLPGNPDIGKAVALIGQTRPPAPPP